MSNFEFMMNNFDNIVDEEINQMMDNYQNYPEGYYPINITYKTLLDLVADVREVAAREYESISFNYSLSKIDKVFFGEEFQIISFSWVSNYTNKIYSRTYVCM